MDKPVLKALALSVSALVLQNTVIIFVSNAGVDFFLPPLSVSLSLFGAPNNFSTRELSSPRRIWHALLS